MAQDPNAPGASSVSHPLTVNSAAVGGVGGAALVGTVVWQVVKQIWPTFTPTPEEVLLTAASIGLAGTYAGGYAAKLFKRP